MANLILAFLLPECQDHFLPSYLYSVCDPAGVKLEKIGETDSPSLIKYLTLPTIFMCISPKSRWHHLSLYSDNLLLKFLLKWKSGDKANSAVTAHSHNGHDGKLVGRELKHPGGINIRHLHFHCISVVIAKPRGKKCGSSFILYIAGAGSKVTW